MSAAVDIVFLRAFNNPSFWATFVVSSRSTFTYGAAVVSRMIVAPLRALIIPLIFS